MNRIGRTVAVATGVLALVMAGALVAQGIQRTLLTKADVSVPGREAVIARVELPAGASAGRHTHPGDEMTYVLEGEAELLIDGQPPRKVKAGDAFVIPAGVIHDARNAGGSSVRLVGVYHVEKDKPLASPAK